MPKMKKLRQWSQDSLANFNQLTNRTNNTIPKFQKTSNCESITIPTTGISTISSAIREQKIDPKRDNFGLYALKCDRSRSVTNARKGILMTLPTTKVRTKAENNSFQSVSEEKHEIFQSCEKVTDPPSGIMYATSSSENKLKIEPPARKKKRQTATRHLFSHSKPKVVLKQASQSSINLISVEKNDSSLYEILNGIQENANISVEELRTKERLVTMVKPKVQKAITIKATSDSKPISKVRNYEWNTHEKKQCISNVTKIHPKKRYILSHDSGSSLLSESSVDIFQSNKLIDQKTLFDEFDALFDKGKEALSVKEISAPSSVKVFEMLNDLKSCQSVEIGSEGEESSRKALGLTTANDPSCNIKTQEFFKKNHPRDRYVNSSVKNAVSAHSMEIEGIATKPRIISERSRTTNKILYYDDTNNHFNTTVLSASKDMDLSVELFKVDATKLNVLSGNDGAGDTRPSNMLLSNTSNTRNISRTVYPLRIFPNDGVFVFNL